MEADLKREKQRSRAPKKRRVLTQSSQVYTEEIRKILAQGLGLVAKIRVRFLKNEISSESPFWSSVAAFKRARVKLSNEILFEAKVNFEVKNFIFRKKKFRNFFKKISSFLKIFEKFLKIFEKFWRHFEEFWKITDFFFLIFLFFENF